MDTPSLPVSPPDPQGRLRSEDIGWIQVPSGQLLVGDPFQGLSRHGNPALAVAPGRYRVVRTLREDADGQTHPLFLSLILSEPLLEERQIWQRRRLERDGSDAWPAHVLSEAGEADDEGDEDRVSFWTASASGCVGLVDVDLFAQGMPPDSEEEGGSWYDRLFEHGRPDSWFDQMDAEGTVGPGAALIVLPHLPEAQIAVAQGASGPKRVFREHAFTQSSTPEEAAEEDEILEELIRHEQPVVALHIDLR